VTAPDEDSGLLCFQVLQKRFSAITVQIDFGQRPKQCYEWLIQPIEVWRSGELPANPNEIDVFLLAEPQRVNVLMWTCSKLARRGTLRRWQQGLSDLDGCMAG
jgi:hypothetical protein